jgi:hypothetical protein
MRYTLWHRDVLVGETDFGLGMRDGSRAGVFHPAASGMAVLPALTAMAPALIGLGEMMERLPLLDEEIERNVDGTVEAITSSPEGQRMLRAAEQIAELELRDDNGKHVPFDSILVSDLQEMTALGAQVRAQPIRGGNGRDPVRYIISATFSKPQGAFGRRRRPH